MSEKSSRGAKYPKQRNNKFRINLKFHITHLKRSDQVIISRIRTGCSKLTHTYFDLSAYCVMVLWLSNNFCLVVFRAPVLTFHNNFANNFHPIVKHSKYHRAFLIWTLPLTVIEPDSNSCNSSNSCKEFHFGTHWTITLSFD